MYIVVFVYWRVRIHTRSSDTEENFRRELPL